MAMQDDDDEIIILDLEDGEIRSDVEETPPKKKKRSFFKIRRSHSGSRKSKTPQKSPRNTDISLEEVTIVGSDEEQDDDCKLIAIIAPANNPTQAAGSALKERKGNFGTPAVGTGAGTSKLGFASRFEEIRRRSLQRRSSASNLLAKRLSISKKDSAKVQPQPQQSLSKKALKRLQKSRWGTPIAPPPVPHRPIRYFNFNHPHTGTGKGKKRHAFPRSQNQQNEERTGKFRKRPLLPNPGLENVHQVLRNPQPGSCFDVNNLYFGNGNRPILPVPLPLLGPQANVFRQPPPLGPPRPVIIDGSNVAIGHGMSKVFSSRGLEICVKQIKVKLRHSEIICFVPKFRAKRTESLDTHILDQLEKDGILKYTPSREVAGKHITSYDDRFILDYATTSGGIVITNDNYKDLFDQEPSWRETIQNRLLQYTWVNDVLMFPADPLGKHGPNLARFCSFDVDGTSQQQPVSNPIPPSVSMLQPTVSMLQPPVSMLQPPVSMLQPPFSMLQPSYLHNRLN